MPSNVLVGPTATVFQMLTARQINERQCAPESDCREAIAMTPHYACQLEVLAAAAAVLTAT